MPRRDGTGPDGNGPKTGRGKGTCPGTNNKRGVRKRDGSGRGTRRNKRRS